MAKLLTKKYQNTNQSSTAFGKWYGRIIHTETLSTEQFVNHICSHGSPFDRATITGVLTAACDCLVELVLDSKKVRLGDLGTFYLSAETQPGNTSEEFSDDNVKKVHLRFWPNQKQSYPLDSISIRSRASFKNIEQLTGDTTNTSDTE
ncbi:MAG: hypothetical protein IJB46_02840 [Prevotella sp.]|nr:hypothetical protein [Prevotella sp.]